MVFGDEASCKRAMVGTGQPLPPAEGTPTAGEAAQGVGGKDGRCRLQRAKQQLVRGLREVGGKGRCGKQGRWPLPPAEGTPTAGKAAWVAGG